MKDPATVDVLHPGKDGATISEAVTSDRRIVIYGSGKICLEAPPDTASNISGSYSGALDASLKAASKEQAPNINAAYGAQLATALGSITNPSQGILFMRFAMATACTAYMDGAIHDDQYYGLLRTAMALGMRLTMFELEKNGGKIGNNVVAVSESAPPTSGATVSLEQLQMAAMDAATDNAGGAGTPSATAAGKDASAAVKQNASADASLFSLALTTGQAAHDAVLKTTQDRSKAAKALVEAMQKVSAFAKSNASAAAAERRIVTPVSKNVPTPNFLDVMKAATAPLSSTNANGAAGH